MKRRYIAGGVICLIALSYLFGWSPIFTVRSFVVHGAPTAQSQSDVADRSKINVGDKLARIDPRAVKAHLSGLTWIQSITVHRNWISRRVSLDLAVRRPIARINSRFLSSDGQTFDLPGGTTDQIPTVNATSQADALAGATFFTSLPAELRAKLLSMQVASEKFTLIINEKGRTLTVRWGDAHDVALKARVYNALVALPENAKISRIDLTAPHAPLVK